MKRIITFFLSMLFIANVNANAYEAASAKKHYIKAEVGGSFSTALSSSNYDHHRPKNSVVFGFGIGHNIDSNTSADISFYHFPSHNFNKIVTDTEVSQKIKSYAILFNLNYDFLFCDPIVPFVTFGGGYANNDVGDYITAVSRSYGKSKGNFAWDVGAGVKGKITEEIKLSLTYKYFDLGKIETMAAGSIAGSPPTVGELGEIKSNLRTHTVMFGIGYHF